MNRSYKKTVLAGCFALAALVSSCVYEDEVPCTCNIRFVYDYNMEFADAFPAQVNDVKLFIFDSDGTFIAQQQDRGEHLDANYRMSLDLKPGTYSLVAWAGTETDPTHYRLPELTSGTSHAQDLTLTLNALQQVSQKNLSHLWHGMLKEFTVTGDRHEEATIQLVKNTNKFRILLQTADEEPLNANDFSFALTADNGLMDYDNSLPRQDMITYLPHVKQTVDMGDNSTAVVAELATLRLMADRTPRFTVTNERNGNALFDIDLVKYLNLMRLDEYSTMSLQEYLDRENTYQVILFLSRQKGTYVVLSIQINAWRMIFNHTDL